MPYLFLTAILPILSTFVAQRFLKRPVLFWDVIIAAVVGALLSSGVYALGEWSQTADVEIVNGAVTKKVSEEVSCTHSYSCNCTQSCSGSGSSRSCTTTCSTCYEHLHDYDWLLHNTAGSPIEIDRIDRQGLIPPPRYLRAKVGDPVALSHVHTNYIKGAPESLFNHAKGVMADTGTIPPYPATVRDYHYVDRTLTPGLSVPDVADWNRGIAEMLKTLGPKKEVNVVVVMTKSADPNYEYALERAWLGGKKNDVVVILGAPEYPKLAWVRIMSWTDRQLFKVELRDELAAMETIDRAAMLPVIEKHIGAAFERKHMRDFEYLKSEISPPAWVVVMAILLGIAASIGTFVYLSGRR